MWKSYHKQDKNEKLSKNMQEVDQFPILMKKQTTCRNRGKTEINMKICKMLKRRKYEWLQLFMFFALTIQYIIV